MKYLLVCILLSGMAWMGCDNRQVKAMQQAPTAEVPATPAAEKPAPDDGILRQTLYTAKDSLRVVELLRAETGANDVLYYARRFLDIPYVGGTFEKADP